MEHYVGLDVSLKQTAICIVDRTGKVQREGIVSSDPEAIAAFIKSYAPNVVRIGLETGPTATWLWTESRQGGGYHGRRPRAGDGLRDEALSGPAPARK